MLEGSQMDKYYGDLLLRVNPSEVAIDKHPEAYQALMGDTLFSGDDPNLTSLDIAVDDMVVYLNDLPEN
ncbi:MAG: hypothetical protein HC922_10945 [Leptolyngbyaceae cyanobacterium SM2_3_12]|nr:hypothetical protein [Leptolyngbyaceae cyanobacterium SM2_3_12]